MSDACERWASLADRRLLGEELSDEEARFAEAHLAECEPCRSEARVWKELATDDEQPPALEPLHAGELVERALRHVTPRPPSLEAERHKRQLRLGAGVAAALAIAAGAILWLRPAAGPELGSFGQLVSVRGEVTIDGRPAADGARLTAGARISTANGRACLTWPGNARACLDRQTQLELASDSPVERRVELSQGTLVTALDPLPRGHAFVVSSGEARVQVKGTVFSVTRAPGRPDVVVRVHDGTVGTRSSSSAELRDVTSGEELTLATGAIGAVKPEVRRRELELVGLSWPEPAKPPEPPPPPASDEASAADAGKPSKASDSGTGPSAGELLREAQTLRAQGNPTAAAAAYRRLQALHPKSPEAAASRLSLAELLLARDPAAALAAYDAYLKSGGALRQEARYGRIMALARLGRIAEERAAVEAFIRDYPNSVQARALSRRAADAAAP